jgi:hypothetical protein
MTVVNKADELTVVDKVVKFIEDRHRANTINMKSDESEITRVGAEYANQFYAGLINDCRSKLKLPVLDYPKAIRYNNPQKVFEAMTIDLYGKISYGQFKEILEDKFKKAKIQYDKDIISKIIQPELDRQQKIKERAIDFTKFGKKGIAQ